jgi:hypothetical protein
VKVAVALIAALAVLAPAAAAAPPGETLVYEST